MVWYGMVWYGMVWYGMVWYGMVWYGMVCNVMLCHIMLLCYIEWRSMMSCYIMSSDTVLSNLMFYMIFDVALYYKM
jgi:hypothetical protein